MGCFDEEALREIAECMENFFKGLTDCGLLGNFNLQLQVPSDDEYDEKKIRNVLEKFAANLKDISSSFGSNRQLKRENQYKLEEGSETVIEIRVEEPKEPPKLQTFISQGERKAEAMIYGERNPRNIVNLPVASVENMEGNSGEGVLWSEVLATADVLPTIYTPVVQEQDGITVEVEEGLDYVVAHQTPEREIEVEPMEETTDEQLNPLDINLVNAEEATRKMAGDMIVIDIQQASSLKGLDQAEDHKQQLAVLFGEGDEDSKEQLQVRKRGRRVKRLKENMDMVAMRRVRARKAAYMCSKCPKMFRNMTEVDRHMESKHGQDLKCDICHDILETVSSLRLHCETQHGIAGCFGCKLCGRRLNTKAAFSRHMDTHVGNKGAVCDVCGKAFSRADYLSRHRRVHNGEKPHICPVCKKGFNNKSNLNTHVLIHSEAKTFSCDACGKGFSRMDKLKEHMLRHLKVKRYQCNYCMKEYAEHRDLKKHLQHHKTSEITGI